MAWDMMQTQSQKAQIKALFVERERELGGTGKQLQGVFNTFARDDKAQHAQVVNQRMKAVVSESDCPWLTFDARGLPEATVANINSIMAFDSRYKDEVLNGTLQYNLLGNYAEIKHEDYITGKTSIRKWGDADEASSKRYIEEVYGIYS